MALSKAQIKDMIQYSRFITIDQLNATISAHLERIQEWLSPATLRVLDVLAKHAIKAIGVAYLKIDTISELAGTSRATVKRTIRLLERLGILSRIEKQRPKLGGDGANYYVFQPCLDVTEPSNDPASMTLRPDHETPTESKDEAPFPEAKSISFKQLQKENNTYVKDFQIEKLFWEFVPQNVPQAFVDHCKTFLAIRNGKTIFEMWGKVLLFKRHHSHNVSHTETLLDFALEAIESTRNAYKRDQRGWDSDRFFGYFYGSLVRIQEKWMNELCAGW